MSLFRLVLESSENSGEATFKSITFYGRSSEQISFSFGADFEKVSCDVENEGGRFYLAKECEANDDVLPDVAEALKEEPSKFCSSDV